MDRRFLQYYERELQHLRETAGDFAKEHPKVAGRLALDQFSCADPYVERLLEGFAFLAARVHLKLDAEFPRFTHSILETVYPHYLAPTPSMIVVQFQPDLTPGSLTDCFPVPRDVAVRSILGRDERTPCEYRTAHNVDLWPLSVVEAGYHTQDLSALEVPSSANAKAAIRIRLQCPQGMRFDQLELDRVNFFLRGADALTMRLYEQFFSHSMGVIVQPTTRPVAWQERTSEADIRRMGFSDEEALLPVDARSFQGYRLLHEYFALPQRFLFVELTGLHSAVRRCQDRTLDLIVLLREADLELESRIDPSNFALFCTPAVNLFPKRSGRIQLSDGFSEFHVVPDRTRPLDFEVYRVLSATGHGLRSDEEQRFFPFYAASEFDEGRKGGGAYYATYRMPRQISSRELRYGRRSSYPGSEVFISLVDAHAAPYRSDLREVSLNTLCTNRDLSLQMPLGHGSTDFNLDISAPLDSVRCVAGPTPPKPSQAEGDVAWRAISHLSLNYLSLVDTQEGGAAAAFRDLLKLYGDVKDAQFRKQLDALKCVGGKPIVRRAVTPGPISFARGIEITVEFDEAVFGGTGVFLLGAVMQHFFAKYVSINSFTETVIRTTNRGEIMRWPVSMGTNQIL